MPLSPRQAVAVVVGSDGSVENRVIDLPPGVTASTLGRGRQLCLARGFPASPCARRRRGWPRRSRPARRRSTRRRRQLVARGLALWSEDGARRPVLIVRGQANLIDERAAADLDRVRQLLDELEGKEEIARLLDRARDGRGDEDFHRIGE